MNCQHGIEKMVCVHCSIRIAMSTPDRVGDILIEMSSKSFHGHADPYVRAEAIKDARAAIIKLMEECVIPSEASQSPGWNSCRRTALSKLKALAQ